MRFIADLHVHSRFSRATAKNLDLENLHIAAQLKGIRVLGTGDFTHPGWFAEIREKLEPAGPGLFKLKAHIAENCNRQVPQSCRGDVRFILSVEISNIYKKEGKTRKNHNLVFFPDMETAHKFNGRLESIGNIHSDGRPILGLDARDLLEIVLTVTDKAYVIPAHIWTPWFSVLGSKSGFDSIRECFEDLTEHIFSVETGLSSDPPMNWRVSGLDGLTLVSNSDAHSPLKLGREANIFDTDLSFDAIKEALKTGDPGRFLGTMEFYPEEGKYHADGHRKCHVCLTPRETRLQHNICHVCGKPLTLGVLYRVQQLADRPENTLPEKHHPYCRIVPLETILAEIFQVKSPTGRVHQVYGELLQKLGPELAILQERTIPEIDRAGVSLLAEAIKRIRENKIRFDPGYDGEFGRLSIFNFQERKELSGQRTIFQSPEPGKKDGAEQSSPDPTPPATTEPGKADNPIKTAEKIPLQLNDRQKQAVEHGQGPLLIVAGPGTGKTRTLIHRIAFLLAEKRARPENILAITFTNKAAEEVRERLTGMLGDVRPFPLVGTFHSLCLKILTEREEGQEEGRAKRHVLDESDRRVLCAEAINQAEKQGIQVDVKPDDLLRKIVSYKQQPGSFSRGQQQEKEHENDLIAKLYAIYQDLLNIYGFYDYEDLIFQSVCLFETDPVLCRTYQERFKYIFVDEYQDINPGQYRLIKALSDPRKDICAIGDPNQSIYGFRGSDVRYFTQFTRDFPAACVIELDRNYRSSPVIIQSSDQVMGRQNQTAVPNHVKKINVLQLATEKAEAVAVGKIIERMIGGIGFHSMDFGSVDAASVGKERSFSDFSVLYRTGRQAKVFEQCFHAAGIPFQCLSKDRTWRQKGVAEIVSLLKLACGAGTFSDLEKVAGACHAVLGAKTLDKLKFWSFQKRLSLQKTLEKAIFFPVPEVSRTGQVNLIKLIRWLAEVKKDMETRNVEEKLRHLAQVLRAKAPLPEDPQITEALNRVYASARRYGRNAGDFLSMAALAGDADDYDARAEKVTLSTLHGAKGLEFPVVFIVGSENGFIPFCGTGHQETDPDEERRLFYVAMTRAQERLFMTWVKTRRIFGQKVPRQISPFIQDIDEQLIEREAPATKRKKDLRVQLSLFE